MATSETHSKIILDAEDRSARGFASARKNMLSLESQAAQVAQKLGQSYGNMGQNVASYALGAAGKYLALGAVVGSVEEVIRRSIGAFAETEKPLMRMGLNAGLTKDQIRSMGIDVSQLAARIHRSTIEAAGGIDTLRRVTNLTLKETMDLLPTVSKGAKSLQIPLNDMAVGVGALMRDLNVRTEKELKTAIDHLAYAARFGLDDLSTYLPELTASMRAVGIEGVDSLGQIVSVLATVRGSLGGTGPAVSAIEKLFAEMAKAKSGPMRDMFLQMQEGAKKGIAPLETMMQILTDPKWAKVAGGDDPLFKLFGGRTPQFILLSQLREHVDQIRVSWKKLNEEGPGEAEKRAKTFSSSFESAFHKVEGAQQRVFEGFGRLLVGAAGGPETVTKPWAAWLNSLADSIDNMNLAIDRFAKIDPSKTPLRNMFDEMVTNAKANIAELKRLAEDPNAKIDWTTFVNTSGFQDKLTSLATWWVKKTREMFESVGLGGLLPGAPPAPPALPPPRASQSDDAALPAPPAPPPLLPPKPALSSSEREFILNQQRQQRRRQPQPPERRSEGGGGWFISSAHAGELPPEVLAAQVAQAKPAIEDKPAAEPAAEDKPAAEAPLADKVVTALDALTKTARIPGDAYKGKYRVEPEVPGMWSEEDEERAYRAKQQMIKDAFGLAGYGVQATGPWMKNIVPESLPGALAKNAEKPAAPSPPTVQEMNARRAARFKKISYTPDDDGDDDAPVRHGGGRFGIWGPASPVSATALTVEQRDLGTSIQRYSQEILQERNRVDELNESLKANTIELHELNEHQKRRGLSMALGGALGGTAGGAGTDEETGSGGTSGGVAAGGIGRAGGGVGRPGLGTGSPPMGPSGRPGRGPSSGPGAGPPSTPDTSAPDAGGGLKVPTSPEEAPTKLTDQPGLVPPPTGGGQQTYAGGTEKQKTAQAVANEMRAQGIPEHVIAGMMANIKSESNFNPTESHFDQPSPKFAGTEARMSHGLFQEGGDEWNVWAADMKKRGLDPNTAWKDPKEQARFVAGQLKGTIGNKQYADLYKRMTAPGVTKEQAAEMFVRGYLKPEQKHQDARSAQYRRGIPGTEAYTGAGTPTAPGAQAPMSLQKMTTEGVQAAVRGAPAPGAAGAPPPGGGGERRIPGRDLKGTDPRLAEIVQAAAKGLPEGYKVQATSGMRDPSAPGFHPKGKATDWQIIGPDGKPISNRGEDTTGLYTQLARNAYGYQEKYHPELTGKFQWGGQFGTSKRNPNEPDLMHFDIGGRRGRLSRYSREKIGATLPPTGTAPPAPPPAAPPTATASADSAAKIRADLEKPIQLNIETPSPANRWARRLRRPHLRAMQNRELHEERVNSYADMEE